jgi:hypothetical protein
MPDKQTPCISDVGAADVKLDLAAALVIVSQFPRHAGRKVNEAASTERFRLVVTR